MPEQKSSNTKAVISLILGIAGLVLCCCLGAPSVILGIIGVILAILSKNDNQGQMDGMAIAGLILSIIAFIVGLSSLCFYIYCFITDGILRIRSHYFRSAVKRIFVKLKFL